MVEPQGKLAIFGGLTVDKVMDYVRDYTVSEDDIAEVERWYLANSSDLCKWGDPKMTPYFVPHLWRRTDADFIGRLSILGYIENHSGFKIPEIYAIDFYNQVASVLTAFDSLDWQDAYRIVWAISARYESTFEIENHGVWFAEAATVTLEHGVQAVIDHIDLFIEGIPAVIIGNVIAGGIDNELLNSVLSGDESTDSV